MDEVKKVNLTSNLRTYYFDNRTYVDVLKDLEERLVQPQQLGLKM